MIHLTENAATHISNYLKNRGKGEGIRVGVKTSGCSGLAYVLEFVDESIHMIKCLNSLVLKFLLIQKLGLSRRFRDGLC
jgi:Fe-S cluster assembly iron-binding protein IscA